MPIYDSRIVLEVARGVKAFLSLRVGITRGGAPGAATNGESPALQRARTRIKNQDALIQKQRRQLQRFRKRLAEKDRQVARLRGRPADKKPSSGAGTGRSEGERGARWLDSVPYEGVVLPPRNLRPCGDSFRNDRFYLESATREVDRLVERLGLSPESRILDVGSGPGRLAIGIIQRLGEVREYCGVDVGEDFIRWGQRHISPEHPNFRFVHVDVENRRYNPDGRGRDSSFAFPFENGRFDIIVLYSVFTHMLTDGVRSYLKEFQRILSPGGKILLTAFVEDGVPDVEENPPGYLGREWSGDLHCVRYSSEFFEELLDESGFRLDRLDRGEDEQDEFSIVKSQGQSGLYISRKSTA